MGKRISVPCIRASKWMTCSRIQVGNYALVKSWNKHRSRAQKSCGRFGNTIKKDSGRGRARGRGPLRLRSGQVRATRTMAIETITQFSRITLDYGAPVARITLNHPPLNVIDIPMMEELTEVLAEIE